MSVLTPGVNGREIAKDYNEIHIHEDENERLAKLEMFIAKRIGEELVKHYPDRQWGVHVDLRGIICIMCPSVSLERGYHLHINGDMIHQLQIRAVKAAGEILERHNVSRNRVVDPMTIEELPRDMRDNVIAPDAAPEKY